MAAKIGERRLETSLNQSFFAASDAFSTKCGTFLPPPDREPGDTRRFP
jgi:hypothetical protein